VKNRGQNQENVGSKLGVSLKGPIHSTDGPVTASDTVQVQYGPTTESDDPESLKKKNRFINRMVQSMGTGTGVPQLDDLGAF
jgi:hypothetical protein